MKKVANLERGEREALILNTADRLKMPPAIIEKDFWVCYMLDYLFHRCPWREHLVFKGGTSLSKAYHIIERFSEDIDLILDWRLLGYRINEPWEDRSWNQQDKFIKEASAKTARFLSDELIPTLTTDIGGEIHDAFDLFLESGEESMVNFAYPQLFQDTSILQVIRLEIGALASWSPCEDATIQSFMAEQYSRVFDVPTTVIRTAVAERTFWEKATILHRETNRDRGKFPARYSRHYYDLYQMADSQVKIKAFQNIRLLQDVVAFKEKFYRCPWAKYEEACPGTIKLVPQDRYFSALEEDYKKMRQMIYGIAPGFSAIISELRKLENEINTL